jgi:hypothetical protein
MYTSLVIYDRLSHAPSFCPKIQAQYGLESTENQMRVLGLSEGRRCHVLLNKRLHPLLPLFFGLNILAGTEGLPESMPWSIWTGIGTPPRDLISAAHSSKFFCVLPIEIIYNIHSHRDLISAAHSSKFLCVLPMEINNTKFIATGLDLCRAFIQILLCPSYRNK